MEQVLDNLILQYGAIGLLITGLVYITKQLLQRLDNKEELHRKERDEIYNVQKQLTVRVIESTEKNTQILSELKTLIKSHNQ